MGLDYTNQTTTPGGAGNVGTVRLDIPQGTQLPNRVRGYVIADVFPLATRTL
ncbi:MAG TPA: hypothetical protein VGY97_06905 [Solirubrobacteraceae bacterium]|nr:hypothetical protein [Solirubrobacteraceae bacterium]